MNTQEQYEFDRLGYLLIPNMLTKEQTQSLSHATDALEEEALERIASPPRKLSLWGQDYHHNPEKGYFAWGEKAFGKTLMIEDFFNADPAYDFLVDHPKTMEYIRAIVQGPIRINNSEIRIRYQGNATGTHMGGPIDHKYRYGFNGKGIDCMMVRMIYFLHDVTVADGAFCVVPASHKSNYSSPYRCPPEEEPGMIGLEAKAGDAILFTENLRHGGLPNQNERARKTLHIGYGPTWMMSQNIATMDEPQYVLPSTLERYTPAQRSLLVLGRQAGK